MCRMWERIGRAPNSEPEGVAFPNANATIRVIYVTLLAES
jgi:hypothetical protein